MKRKQAGSGSPRKVELLMFGGCQHGDHTWLNSLMLMKQSSEAREHSAKITNPGSQRGQAGDNTGRQARQGLCRGERLFTVVIQEV